MTAFEYADADDRLTGRLIAENYDEAYWSESESLVLDRMHDFLVAHFGGERLAKARMMDLGCGMGRLIPRFAPLVAQVVAIEPDATRAAAAETCIQEAGLENAIVLNCDSSEYLAGGSGDKGSFDIILCSHVFQHIPHAVTQGILRDVRALLSVDGVFLMTTTFSDAEESEYSLEEFVDDKRVVRSIDEGGFDAAMGRQGTLPVCRFARLHMESLLGEAGLQLRQFGCFHFEGEHDASRDAANTADPSRCPAARDAFYIAVAAPLSADSFDISDHSCSTGPVSTSSLRAASGSCGQQLFAGAAGCPNSAGFPAAPPATPPSVDSPITASAKICFMQYFSLKDRQCLRHAPDHVYRLAPSGQRAAEVEGEFATAESFLYGGGLRFPTQRFVLAGWRVKATDAAGAPLPIRSSHVVVSLYASVGICQIDLCLNLDETGVENLVYLHQIQAADGIRFEFVREEDEAAAAATNLTSTSVSAREDVGDADGANGANDADDAEGAIAIQQSRLIQRILQARFLSVPELCRQILDGLSFIPAGSSSAYLVEVNRMREGDSDPAEPECLSARQRGSLYGILTGDEGWQYAPAALVEDRMANSWSTRSFAKAIVFSNNYVLVNFNRGALARDYELFQNETGTRFYGGVNAYFLQDAQTAGVNHGLFFSVETSMIVRTISVRLLAERPETTSGRFGFLRGEITRSRQYRGELISVLEEMNRFEISELGELDVLVARSLSVQERTKSIREMLELTESDLDLKYQTNTNALVTLLTVIGLVFAALQVLQAFWG